MTVAVGSPAPDFTVKDHRGEEVTLSSLRGQTNVLLVFYPFAFSGICTGELCAIRDDGLISGGEGVRVMGISCDPMWSLRAWAEAQGYDFSLLSDFWPHGAVAQSYGVFLPDLGFATRGSFLIDHAGIIRWRVVNAPGEARPTGEYREALAALG